MNEKVKQYLDAQMRDEKEKEKVTRAKVLIEAGLYDSYIGPHVEELFDPVPPLLNIRKTDSLQYVTEKATGLALAVQYNYKEQEFEVLTPLQVTDEEYIQIKKYSKHEQRTILDMVLLVFAILFYMIAFAVTLFLLGTTRDIVSLAIGAGILGTGLMLHALSVILSRLKK